MAIGSPTGHRTSEVADPHIFTNHSTDDAELSRRFWMSLSTGAELGEKSRWGKKTLSELYPTLILLGGGSLQSRKSFADSTKLLSWKKILHSLYERSPPLFTVILKIQVWSIGVEHTSSTINFSQAFQTPICNSTLAWMDPVNTIDN